MDIVHYIILFLSLVVLYLLQRNRIILKEIVKLSEDKNKEKNIFEKNQDAKMRNRISSSTVILDKEILVYDDWQKELQLVIFNKSADNFPFLITLVSDLDLEEAVTLFKDMKKHYDKGGRLYDLSDYKDKTRPKQ